MTMTASTQPEPQAHKAKEPPAKPPRPARPWWRIPLIIVLGVIAYAVLGAWATHRINDTWPAETPRAAFGESETVRVLSTLLRREVEDSAFTPDDPWFLPGAWLQRMPSFQRGVVEGTAAMLEAWRTGPAIPPGEIMTDHQLTAAAKALTYPPERWWLDRTALDQFGPSAARRYGEAADALDAYNVKLGGGKVRLGWEATGLVAMLRAVTARLAADATALRAAMTSRSDDLWDDSLTAVVYGVKGHVLVLGAVVQALGQDFHEVVARHRLDEAYATAVQALLDAAALAPPVVLNGGPEAMLAPNHLAILGFDLLRADLAVEALIAVLEP